MNIEPHRLMHALVTELGLDIPMQRVHDYWRIHRDELQDDWAVQSPASNDHIPFALYGDGAKIHDDGTKVAGIFLSLPAVWKPRSCRCARWCVFAIEEHVQYHRYTMDAVLRFVTASSNVLFHGVDPITGLVLCNGLKFTVTELKGDWQWHKLVMRFRSSWQKLDSVCFLRDAKGRSHDPLKLH